MKMNIFFFFFSAHHFAVFAFYRTPPPCVCKGRVRGCVCVCLPETLTPCPPSSPPPAPGRRADPAGQQQRLQPANAAAAVGAGVRRRAAGW